MHDFPQELSRVAGGAVLVVAVTTFLAFAFNRRPTPCGCTELPEPDELARLEHAEHLEVRARYERLRAGAVHFPEQGAVDG